MSGDEGGSGGSSSSSGGGSSHNPYVVKNSGIHDNQQMNQTDHK